MKNLTLNRTILKNREKTGRIRLSYVVPNFLVLTDSDKSKKTLNSSISSFLAIGLIIEKVHSLRLVKKGLSN